MLRNLTGAALLAVTLAVAGCGDGAESPPAAPQAGDRPDTPDEAAAAAAKAKGDGTVATKAEDFLPVLRAAHGDVTWPAGYEMSAEQIWGTMSGAAHEVVYTEADARQSVSIWNICAWTLQLVDDAKAGRDVAADTSRLEALAANDPGMRPIVDQMVSGARLGDVGTAEQFVEANGCARGFE